MKPRVSKLASHAARCPRSRCDCRSRSRRDVFRLAVAHGGDLRVGEHHGRLAVRSRAASPPVMLIAARVPPLPPHRRTEAGRCSRQPHKWWRTGAHALVDDDGPLRIGSAPAASNARLRVFGALPVATSAGRRVFHRTRWSARIRRPHADLAGLRVFQYLDPFGTERGLTASPMAGSSRKNSVLRARISLCCPAGQRLAPVPAPPQTSDHGQALGNGVADQGLGGSPEGDSFRPGIGGTAGLAPVATGSGRTPPHARRHRLNGRQGSVVLETRFTMQHGDGRVAVQVPSYLAWRSSSTRACCWASSCCDQSQAQSPRCHCRMGFHGQMGDMGSADHDLGRHAADIAQVPPMVPRSISVTFAPCSTPSAPPPSRLRRCQ